LINFSEGIEYILRDIFHKGEIHMATLKDVALKAGVSLTTASYVINGKGNISEKTAQKVLQAANELGYISNKYPATDKSLMRKNIIGFATSNFKGPFFSELLGYIEESAISNGCLLVAYSTAIISDRCSPKHIFETHKPNGLILTAYNISDKVLLKYSSANFPIVTLDRKIEGDYIFSVTIDNFKGAYDIVKYLLECGHREIAFMGGSYMTYETEMRYKGYCEALKEYGIDPSSQIYCQGGRVIEGGYNTAKLLIAQNRIPEAMFCDNDEMAIGVMKACNEAGINIPEDLSLVGFDDISLATHVKPALTTVRQPIKEWANAAVQTLIMALHGSKTMKHLELSPEVVVRESVKVK